MGTVPTDMQLAENIGILVWHLSDQVDGNVQENAAGQLATLAESYDNSRLIAKSAGAIDGLVRLLFADATKTVHFPAVRALANLAAAPENGDLIVATKGVLRGLFGLLSNPFSEDIQSQAARALSHLTIRSDVSICMGRVHNALQHVVQLLHTDVSNRVQLHIAKAVVHLTVLPENQLTIAAIPNAFKYLVELHKRNQLPIIPELAAATLRYLAFAVQNEVEIAGWQCALRGLVDLLFLDTRPYAQEFAARAIQTLAAEDRNGVTVAVFPRAIQGLAELLWKTEHETLQMAAAGALRNLAREPENRCRIAFFQTGRALKGLAKLLKGSPIVQQPALEALVYISAAPEPKFFICGLDYAVEGLVNLLSNYDCSDHLQILAAQAIANLAFQEVSYFLATFPGVLLALEGLLQKDSSPDAQKQAARAVAFLALSNGKAVLEPMLSRFLPGLVGLLRKDEHPAVQELALRALKYLAKTSQYHGLNNQSTILQYPGALEAIGRLGSGEFSQGVQEAAAKAVEMLGRNVPEARPQSSFPLAGARRLAQRKWTVDETVQFLQVLEKTNSESICDYEYLQTCRRCVHRGRSAERGPPNHG